MPMLSDALGIAGVAAAVLGLAWAAVSDITRFEIPNRACGLVAAGFALAAIGAPIAWWGPGLTTGLLGLALGLGLFSRGWLGGGDVKLAAAIALWAGPGRLADFAVVTALAGLGVTAVMLSPLGRRMPHPPGEVAADFRHPMPFGAPLALGGAWVAFCHLATLS
jgi:prepilin peptidase CpaA